MINIKDSLRKAIKTTVILAVPGFLVGYFAYKAINKLSLLNRKRKNEN
jgi:hypothetical protein